MQSLRGTSPVHRMSSPQSQAPGTLVEAGSAGCTLVDPPDSLVPCESDHEEVSVFDNLVDSDEELEFEENLRRGNFSTVPGVPLQNRFSPLVESPIVRETVIDEGSKNLHVSSEDEVHVRPNSDEKVVPRIVRTPHIVADNLPFPSIVCVRCQFSVTPNLVFGILRGLLLQVSKEIVDHLSYLFEAFRLVIGSGTRGKCAPFLLKYRSSSFMTTFNL